MKKINKISIFLFLLLGVAFTSCETTDLDLLDDPNQITNDNGNLDFFLNSIQLDYASFIRRIGRNGAQLSRVEYMFGRTYENNYQPVASDGIWSTAYAGMFSDMAIARPLAESQEAFMHLGVMDVLQAHTLLTLVDFYGDVPYSEAANPADFPNPNLDDDASVYEAAIGLLDSGINYLQQGGSLATDLFYGNDEDKWIDLANSLKMGAYVNTRLVDGNAMSKFNAIVNSGKYISSTSGDFQFQYGTSETAPDTRHPAYSADYTATGAGRYRSNWLMDAMLNDDDPRRRYYFYRQFGCTPGAVDVNGNDCGTDQQRLICSTQARPGHYPSENDMVFCSVDSGYWGRDHGNAEGIPPDNFRRTVVGVYPAAGNFDDADVNGNGYDQVNQAVGGQGAGILPIMLSSWTELMRAEMALANGNTGSARTLLESALTTSISKVQGFGSVDPDGDLSAAPSSAEVAAFITAKGAEFNGADSNGKWNILAVQHFVAHYGNGIETYNFYRRTGFPRTLQFNIEPSSGNFIRSFLYSANEANLNFNIPQKPNVDVQVFWDNNPPSPGFPFAN